MAGSAGWSIHHPHCMSFFPFGIVRRVANKQDLHDALVCPLPSGSRLVIVLDLYRYELFRRHAMLSDVAPAVSDFHLHALHAGPLRRSGLTDVPSSFTPSSSTAFGLSTRRGAGSPHITRGTTKRLGSLSRLRTKSKWLGGRLRVPTSLYQNINELESEEPHGEPWVLSDSQAMRCESPEAVDVGHRMFDGGFTIEDQDTSVRAEVIRLASCRDAWQEGENGGTTISQLVDILKKNPYLSLKDLSEQVAQLQRAWGKKGREYQYQRRWYLRRTVSLPLLVEPSPALPARSATLGSVNSGSCKKAALLLQVQEGFESMRQMLKAPIPPHLNGRDTMYGFEDPELASSRSLVMK
ncbi:hypothetical protein R3P38DRAFT_1280335 [Favolaschia claudopus]|uniref:Uncharacterized protein n=1 Tax=Favolaschia claudopus TaxID=2862362 RepID=A0AAW0B1H9_9AGAR